MIPYELVAPGGLSPDRREGLEPYRRGDRAGGRAHLERCLGATMIDRHYFTWNEQPYVFSEHHLRCLPADRHAETAEARWYRFDMRNAGCPEISAGSFWLPLFLKPSWHLMLAAGCDLEALMDCIDGMLARHEREGEAAPAHWRTPVPAAVLDHLRGGGLVDHRLWMYRLDLRGRESGLRFVEGRPACSPTA